MNKSFVQTLHDIGKESKECGACRSSERPACKNCGHALTGAVNQLGVVTCGMCESKYTLDETRLHILENE